MPKYVVVPDDYIYTEDDDYTSVMIETEKIYDDLADAEEAAVTHLESYPRATVVVLDISPIKMYRADVTVNEVPVKG